VTEGNNELRIAGLQTGIIIRDLVTAKTMSTDSYIVVFGSVLIFTRVYPKVSGLAA
jgi:hypothetical protein